MIEIHVSETFGGDIEGNGVVRFLQAVRPDRTASFVGIERVTGRIGDRHGTFLLQDAGTLEGKTVSCEWFVIPDSGTGMPPAPGTKTKSVTPDAKSDRK